MRRGLVLSVVLIVAVVATWIGLAASRQTGDDAPAGPSADSPQTAAVPRAVPRVRAAEQSEETDGDDLDSAAADEHSGPKVVLRIVDGAGDPIRHVYVTCVEPEGAAVNTSDDGEAYFAAVDGTRRVSFFDGVEERVVELKAPRTEAVVTAFPRAEVVVIDGATGEAMPAVGVSLSPYRGMRRQMVSGDRSGPTTGVDDDGETTLWAYVEPPPGYGCEESADYDGRVAIDTARVRLVALVYPEFTVRLAAVDETGAPVAGTRVLNARIGDAPDPWQNNNEVTFRTDPAGADGVLVARLPSIPWTQLSVRVTPEDSVGWINDEKQHLFGTLSGITPDAAGGEPLRVTLRRGEMKTVSTGSGGTGCGFPRSENPVETAPIVVHVVHRDGRPARRVRVDGPRSSDFTGMDGTVTFEKVPRGLGVFVAKARGFLPAAVEAHVGAVAQFTIQEAEPRRVRVTVVDEAGRAQPAACVEVSSRKIPGPRGDVTTYVDVAYFDGDCEVLNPHTGADGTLTIEAPPGVVRYHVKRGAASAEVESAADEVRVVLRDPRRTAK